MRIRTRPFDPANAPSEVRSYLGQPLVTVGKEYEVHAVANFQGISVLQLVDDLGYPSWKPAWLFEVVDPSIPGDWICSTFRDDPCLVLGPAFVAASLEGYNAMVELEPAQVERFWQRVERQHTNREEDD